MGSLYCPISSLSEVFSVTVSKVYQSLTDSFCSWGWYHQSSMVMLMLTMKSEERVECPKLSEDVIRTTECRNIGSKRMFRVTCSFSLKSLSHSSAITSFLLRYPDLVSPRTFSVKKFHRISWNHYLIGREYRQENYPEMWNLGSVCRAMSAARATFFQIFYLLHIFLHFTNKSLNRNQ